MAENETNVSESKKCDRDTEVYSRVCGFFRPVQQWNKGKKEEYKEREEFVVDQRQIGGTDDSDDSDEDYGPRM